jgi:HK97 family phage major capsid protein
MFTYKTETELEAMDSNARDQYAKEKRKFEANATKEQIEKANKELKEKLEEQIKEIKGSLEEIGLKVQELTEAGNEQEKSFLAEITEKKEEVKELVKGGLNKEILLKAATLTTSINSNTNALKLPGIGQYGRKGRSLYDVFKKVQVAKGDHNGQIRYHDWDEATTVSAAAAVAEGATFPESTATFREYKEDIMKIGDTLPVSEEFGEDEVSAAAELERFIDLNINSVVDTQIAVGTGLAGQLKGLLTQTPVFTPVSSNINDANIYDLAKKMRTTIVKNRGSKYQPDFVAMNSDTYDQLVLKKDANNNYIFPDRDKIGSMMIVEDNNLPDNQLIVGDSRFGEIYEMGGVVLSKVMINDQGVKDMITLKGRKRLLFLIRNVDKTGFLKCTNIATALGALA